MIEAEELSLCALWMHLYSARFGTKELTGLNLFSVRRQTVRYYHRTLHDLAKSQLP